MIKFIFSIVKGIIENKDWNKLIFDVLLLSIKWVIEDQEERV